MLPSQILPNFDSLFVGEFIGRNILKLSYFVLLFGAIVCTAREPFARIPPIGTAEGMVWCLVYPKGALEGSF